MHIKKWLNNEDQLHYFSLKDVEFKFAKYSRNNKRFNYDPFIVNEMYERDGVEFNSTEMKLSRIESLYKEVQDKIIKQSNNNEIKLTRKDIEILKTFIFTMKIRNKSLFERFKNLDGDPLFKLKYKDMSIDERYNVLYEKIDLYIDMQMMKLDDDLNNPSEELKKLNEKLLSDPITSVACNQNTSIKIFTSKSESFLLTDQFSSGVINPIEPGGFLIGFNPIAPNICIGILNENAFVRSFDDTELDIFASGKDFVSKYFNWNRSKFFKFDGVPCYKFDGYDFRDVFTYSNNILSNNEVSVINAYLTTQSSDIIAYKNITDLENAFEAEKEFGIHRGEDDYKNINDQMEFKDIYGNEVKNEHLEYASYAIIDSLVNMLKFKYSKFLFQINESANDEDLYRLIIKNMKRPIYDLITQDLIKLIYTEKNLIFDEIGNYALSDNMLNDPEMALISNVTFLWNEVFAKYAKEKSLKDFIFIGNDSAMQGEANGPDWVFLYEDGFKLGVEITSSICPIFIDICSSFAELDDLDRIAKSVVENNKLNINNVKIEWRKNRVKENRLDLIIKRKLQNNFKVDYGIFEEIVLQKIEKSKKYYATDKLVILFQASSFDLDETEIENLFFSEIEKGLNKRFEKEYDNKVSVKIL